MRKLDPENPVLYLVGSPEGGKIEHIPRMLSSQKANSLEEIIKWKKKSLQFQQVTKWMDYHYH